MFPFLFQVSYLCLNYVFDYCDHHKTDNSHSEEFFSLLHNLIAWLLHNNIP